MTFHKIKFDVRDNPLRLSVIINRLLVVSLLLLLTTGSNVMSSECGVILSGGPGTFDPRDKDHDQSWANYVTAPQLSGFPRHGNSDVFWIIYRPAYVERWADDFSDKDDGRRQQEIKRVLSISPDIHSYADLLVLRAKQHGWKLIWISNADEFWQFMRNINPTVLNFRYYGHAKYDLWLDLNHNDKGEPVAPNPQAIIRSIDISKIVTVANQPSQVIERSAHLFHKPNEEFEDEFENVGLSEFFGCNTFAFAAEWARVFQTRAIGLRDKIDFRLMQDQNPAKRAGYGDSQVVPFNNSPKPKKKRKYVTMKIWSQ